MRARKRDSGAGTLRRRSDGRWEARIQDGFKDDGKPKMKSFYGPTQKAAKENWFVQAFP